MRADCEFVKTKTGKMTPFCDFDSKFFPESAVPFQILRASVQAPSKNSFSLPPSPLAGEGLGVRAGSRGCGSCRRDQHLATPVRPLLHVGAAAGVADRGNQFLPLYAAILRDVATKGKDVRFKKVERGQFALNRQAVGRTHGAACPK